MTTTCPACNKAVDPLRSRFVGVLGGKVVAYCSAACSGVAGPAPGDPAGPVAKPTTPAVLIAPPSATPPVVTEATAKRAPAARVAPARPDTPVTGVPVNIESGPVIEIVREPASEAVAARPAEEPRTPRAKHPDEISIGAFWTADKTGVIPVGGLDAAASTAAAPAVASPAPAAASKPPSGGRDDTLDKWTAEAERSSATLASSDMIEISQVRGKSRLPLVIVILALLGAGGLLVYRYVTKSKASAATRPAATLVPAPAPAPMPPAPVVPAPIDPVAALERARITLTTHLAATSPRVQRIAAAALARTSDPAARDVLAGQLGLSAHAELQARAGRPDASRSRDVETSDIARLDLAYSLARAGDKRGRDMLAQALISPRAEARDEAARLLALLGDARAVPRLTDVLAVSQRRLGAAEHLAHLAEPRAIGVLEQLRGDARASADDKARATIALGIAHHADVAPALRDMLSDPHFNAFAAAALAELKDPVARPVLERQLDSPALRVRSARALRRLDPALDPTPLLPRLLDVLAAGRDTDQVQAAEAILLLSGPDAWAAYQ